MSRIEKKFKSLDRPALVNFITAGDPDHQTSLEAFKALAGAGADIIELGMPFTDPTADGSAIQKASERALAAGANMKQTLSMVRDFRAEDQETPIVLMGYYNPIFAYGLEAFSKDASEAGVDGLIIVDLPPEEDAPMQAALKGQDIDLIRLITPVTDKARLTTLLQGASGFLYYVSITGVTGTASADINALTPHVQEIKSQTDLPVVIGFGIKTPEDVKEMAQIGDGVVVGSAIVNILQSGGVEAVKGLVSDLSSAIRSL
ncbi:MAG: tryptophan synthase subunit alpha [Micavibrio sp. TMED27]|nr:tryptophan synthase subunit alpha [Micavibrio sp.]OUT91309.1 MAG: tryptophan synthase subunit alpha [Micavibrio sp. TMED27]|tara:strand:- start:476 stop:1255 length:780 start_codon:yes stop_codon:yes gene_type:complete